MAAKKKAPAPAKAPPRSGWRVLAYRPVPRIERVAVEAWAAPSSAGSERFRGHDPAHVSDGAFFGAGKPSDADVREHLWGFGTILLLRPGRALWMRLATDAYAELEQEDKAENGGPFEHTPTAEEYAAVMGEPPAVTVEDEDFDVVSVEVTPATVAREGEAMEDEGYVKVALFRGGPRATLAMAKAFAATVRPAYEKWLSLAGKHLGDRATRDRFLSSDLSYGWIHPVLDLDDG